ncbi:uncharacterized protein A1O9_09419 [Exophiala aquamarina CBS 119918]|uniref:FAD dependent oxidoreductase domain-containing protein n=1 Tax=Exophiala aquamarina CBS 119918 TaxID=1182545 RepID=A0A072P4R7_9EURO|nr:uncharacterized protein A1O9_09419 [Exophiala aquamarina CBS 119918]KEF54253.1 hypothetical protein A1O9_09419 [Exophiala aquamarina CBS 119918]
MAPSQNKMLPVQNGLTSFWLTQPHELHDHRTTPSIPEQSDIVIIGAGYAGAATAYHLLNESIGVGNLSITILEARGACSGATGRNGGHLRPDLYGHIPKYIARAGVRAGAEIAEFEIENMWAIKKTIENERINCDFTMARSVDVWCQEKAAKDARAAYDMLVSLGLDYMKDVFFTDVPEQAEAYSGVKGALAAASYTAGTMWPYKFVLGLLEPVLSTGKVNLQTHTPVLSVKPDEKRGFVVETERGTIYAKQVVHASNGYVSGLLPEYERNIIPCKGICSHIEIPVQNRSKTPLFTNSYSNRTEDNTGSYLIPRLDSSIIVGGAAQVFRPFRDQWYGNVDDSVLIDAAKGYYEDYMQRTYRGWENTGAQVAHIWTGVMGYSFDSNPHIGSVPSKPGQFILAGFNGHGMPVIWLGAKGLAKMVLAERVGEKLPFSDTGIPTLFQTSQFRIDRAWSNKEEDGDILGTGHIFLPTLPIFEERGFTSKL